MANEMTNNFLLKLFEKTGDKEGVRFFDRYEIGQEVALLDKIQTDHIVDILASDGFVAKNEVIDTKIRITNEGRKRLKNNTTT
jgi:hypothetical protein